MSAARRTRERERRVALNEAVFRGVNEELAELADEPRPGNGRLDLICECGDASCADRIRLGRSDYEAVRADPRLFVVVAGHENASVEEVVRREAAVNVVRKHSGVPAEVAVETDPRRS